MRACHPENEPAAGIEERIDRVEKAIENGVVDGKEHLAAMYKYRETYGAK